jgi:hypothetical protein
MNQSRRPNGAALLAVAAVAALAVVAVAVAPSLLAAPGVTLPPGATALPTRSEPTLPDLVMPPMGDFNVWTNPDGEVHLKFTATIANAGPGPLWLRAARPNTGSNDWRLWQRVAEAAGGFTEREFDGVMQFGGHGHGHWHVRSGASYALTPVSGGDVRTQTKAGFCFFDQVRLDPAPEHAPAQPVFDTQTCGKEDWVELEMGMSAGWSDPYLWALADQEVDVRGLPVGRYRLEATADPDDWFEESDETNNGTWAIVELYDSDGLMAVRVIELAPAP